MAYVLYIFDWIRKERLIQLCFFFLFPFCPFFFLLVPGERKKDKVVWKPFCPLPLPLLRAVLASDSGWVGAAGGNGSPFPCRHRLAIGESCMCACAYIIMLVVLFFLFFFFGKWKTKIEGKICMLIFGVTWSEGIYIRYIDIYISWCVCCKQRARRRLTGSTTHIGIYGWIWWTERAGRRRRRRRRGIVGPRAKVWHYYYY